MLVMLQYDGLWVDLRTTVRYYGHSMCSIRSYIRNAYVAHFVTACYDTGAMTNFKSGRAGRQGAQ